MINMAKEELPYYIEYELNPEINHYYTPCVYNPEDIVLADDVVTKVVFKRYRLSQLFRIAIFEPYCSAHKDLKKRKDICCDLIYNSIHLKDCFDPVRESVKLTYPDDTLHITEWYEVTGSAGTRIRARWAHSFYHNVDWPLLLNIWELMENKSRKMVTR